MDGETIWNTRMVCDRLFERTNENKENQSMSLRVIATKLVALEKKSTKINAEIAALSKMVQAEMNTNEKSSTGKKSVAKKAPAKRGRKPKTVQ
jgi:hypothetical protein